MTNMQYRRLGRSGLKVSVLSFGSWVTFSNQLDTGLATDCMVAAREAGVNFFDNAETYAGGKSEEIMGQVFSEQAWPRWSYIVSTKFFFGIHDDVNMQSTLNRKYLSQAIDASLERLQVSFVDLAYCHRPDPETPLEETVHAMSDMVSSGKALYWGTSEWSAAEIYAAIEIAERKNLHKPIVEQPEYNLLNREKVEVEYARLYEDHGLGLTTWSPLKSGILTGKYLDGVPDGSRAALGDYAWLRDSLVDTQTNERVANLKPIADELGCTMAQLAIAWCAANPNVSSVITGASRVEQVEQNMGALDVLSQLDEPLLARISEAIS